VWEIRLELRLFGKEKKKARIGLILGKDKKNEIEKGSRGGRFLKNEERTARGQQEERAWINFAINWLPLAPKLDGDPQ